MWRARPHYVSGLRSEYFRPPRSTLAGSCRKSAAQRTRNTGHRFSASQRSHGICKGEGEALIPLKYVAGIGCISLTATAGAKFCGNLLPISVLWVQRSQPNHRNQYVYPQRAIAITSKEVSPDAAQGGMVGPQLPLCVRCWPRLELTPARLDARTSLAAQVSMIYHPLVQFVAHELATNFVQLDSDYSWTVSIHDQNFLCSFPLPSGVNC